MRRRDIIKTGAVGGLAAMAPSGIALAASQLGAETPILVAVELSGGNDGLNTVIPYADDAYYRQRPRIGIPASETLPIDDHFGFNPGMLGFKRLWDEGKLAIVHGCGYERPSYSHFTAMAYWHTGVPHGGDRYGWMGRVADALAPHYREDMLINIASSQSLAVKSAVHTPVVFDDPERFQRHRWLASAAERKAADNNPPTAPTAPSGNANRDFLNAVNVSAQTSSARIRTAWQRYRTPVDYGIAPVDLPKVAACIGAGLPTQLYYVTFRNNAFDTHVQQPALHRRLLSYACDGIHGFVKDLERLGQSQRVVVMVFSEFGRRVPENANLGTDHGSANVMFLIGDAINGGHYGDPPSLTNLVDGDNLQHTIDFRQVYATAIERWLKVPSAQVLHESFEPLPVFV